MNTPRPVSPRGSSATRSSRNYRGDLIVGVGRQQIARVRIVSLRVKIRLPDRGELFVGLGLSKGVQVALMVHYPGEGAAGLEFSRDLVQRLVHGFRDLSI